MSWPIKAWSWPLWLLLSTLVWTAGCSKPAGPSAAGAVTGYVCLGCKAKFYVAQDFVPEFCPQCKSTSIQPVVGYLCAADGHLTLGTRRSKPLPCEQCGVQTTGLRAPTAAELEAFGAVRKTKADFWK